MINKNQKPDYEDEKKSKHEKIIILGSGPAGLSAALYAARAELSPLLLTGSEPGGQAALTFSIENYPGFPDGVGGTQLGELFQKQAEKFGTRIEFDIAESVDLTKRPLTVTAGNGKYSTDTLIIATGARSNHLGIPGEDKLIGMGVSYCATCDGAFFKGKKVIVVGGGDSALEEGLFLTRYASLVTILHRRNEFRAGPLLQTRVMNHPKMNFMMNSIITEINGIDRVDSVIVQDIINGHESTLGVEGVFIFVGHTPNTQIFTGQIEMEKGYIKVDQNMHTNVPGVFAAGEAADPRFRQVITSAGMGAAAAMEAVHYLEEKSSHN
jgi:thioredoxin reductase (NADPH)